MSWPVFSALDRKDIEARLDQRRSLARDIGAAALRGDVSGFDQQIRSPGFDRMQKFLEALDIGDHRDAHAREVEWRALPVGKPARAQDAHTVRLSNAGNRGLQIGLYPLLAVAWQELAKREFRRTPLLE